MEKPNTSSSWAESWRTWHQSLVKDIPLHNDRWSAPFLTLWKILALAKVALCLFCQVFTSSWQLLIRVIPHLNQFSEKASLCHKHKRNVILECFAWETLINLIDFMSVKMVNRQLVCVMFRRH